MLPLIGCIYKSIILHSTLCTTLFFVFYLVLLFNPQSSPPVRLSPASASSSHSAGLPWRGFRAPLSPLRSRSLSHCFLSRISSRSSQPPPGSSQSVRERRWWSWPLRQQPLQSASRHWTLFKLMATTPAGSTDRRLVRRLRAKSDTPYLVEARFSFNLKTGKATHMDLVLPLNMSLREMYFILIQAHRLRP